MADAFEDQALTTSILSRLTAWEGYTAIASLISRFPELGIFLAGGSIRNLILGYPVKDFDFFFGGMRCDAALSHLAELGKIDKGALGSPRWSPASGSAASCDLVPIERVNHGLGNCTTIIDVLNQFDFTGNAIAFDMRTYMLFDPRGGRGDLERRIMRATRFDFPDVPVLPTVEVTWRATRWFRILHYAATLNLQIEPVTLEWLKANRNHLHSRKAFSQLFFTPHLDLLNNADLFEELRVISHAQV